MTLFHKKKIKIPETTSVSDFMGSLKNFLKIYTKVFILEEMNFTVAKLSYDLIAVLKRKYVVFLILRSDIFHYKYF